MADYTVKCREGEWNFFAAVACICIAVYVIGLPGFELYYLMRNRKNLHRENCLDPKQQRRIEKEFGSVYAHYRPEAYYFDIVDLFRRLILTGGLIMMGEESVAQIFLGAVVCVLWLSLLIYMQPYASVWDNVIAIVLGLHLALTLMAGMAIKLYDSTPGQDEYQRRGFGWVLTTVTIFCVMLSTISTLVGTPLVQSIYKAWKKRQEIHKLRKMQKKRSKRKVKKEF